MTTFTKIRLLLALLCASLLLTAIILRNSYTPRNGFMRSAHLLEENLHQKEKQVDKLFSGKQFELLKQMPDNNQEALKLIENLTVQQRIWLVTYKNNKLAYWTGVKVIPERFNKYKPGSSFIKESNGYYEAIQKTEGNFTAIAFIFVKSKFRFQNEFLQNVFEPKLLRNNNIDIADVDDKDVYHIHNNNKQYLFSVKLVPDAVNYTHLTWEIVLWLAGLLFLCLLVISICNHFVHRKKFGLSVVVLACSILLIRFINLYFHLPDFSSSLRLFNPHLFTLNKLFPSLGDLGINTLFLCWFVAYLYSYRHKLLKRPPAKTMSYLIFIGAIGVLMLASSGMLYLYKQLVTNSNINFDVNNVLNLTGYSLVGVLLSCFSFLIFYLLVETLLVVNEKLSIKPKVKLAIFAGVILAATLISLSTGFTLFYLLWALLVFIRYYSLKYDSGTLNAVTYVSIILICSWIASIKLNRFEADKEKGTRKQLIEQLNNGNNPKLTQIFKNVEKQIVRDPVLQRYFSDTSHNAGYLRNRFQRLYFDGYLSDFDCTIHEFDRSGRPIQSNDDYILNDFKDMVVFSSIKVSDYFYRENENFGFLSYFAILPVYAKDALLGTVIVELKSKAIQDSGSFPELLIDNQFKRDTKFKNYSFAFYSDGHLLSQSGSYDYNVVNADLKGELKKYTFKTTYEDDDAKPWYQRLTRYSHLIYQPSLRKVIVVSAPENDLVTYVASLTFFFVVLLAFSAIIILVNWLWRHVTVIKVTSHSIRWNFGFKRQTLLYKTRIQFSMIFAVVVTLVLVGVITFLSITTQYEEQQNEMISTKITTIAAKFESIFPENLQNIDEDTQVRFNNFADNFSTDLILFNKDGIPVLSTRPKIYDYGILGRRMHARAFVLLNKLQKSLLINDERIGILNYKAAYVPIRTSKSGTIGYLQLPYFSNEADYRERIGTFLNAMINIYALIFVAIGMFAVLVARQITAPLSFIQYNLSKTIYGKKNEPIKWNQDDEIGALIKEYNKMIAALENSAQRLAQSERESAWREMAKQVAHEIKNPLTPLKLGLQLLEKSWRDKDPRFDAKFERFSKSFVEQIESLSSIASEFSAFAKMPDTRMQRLSMFETLGQAVIIFKHMDNVKIIYEQPETEFMVMADRDQLLRCFNNLLKNAIEAMPESRLGVIEITYTINRGSVLLKIQDNGNGIPENLRDRIFEPNFTTKSSGTGLGLAFVKNSIENAGGRVWYETVIGEGTTFFLNFPEAKG
ncbi:ATP-binding protein [Mucilaginibacter sp. PAMB04274]|uniref:sensor histidine kinase n=1 Tax=Mucilaginibacter sp. PAMB04274 TaxID=3138568 RepID=UPI0031F715FA